MSVEDFREKAEKFSRIADNAGDGAFDAVAAIYEVGAAILERLNTALDGEESRK